MIREHAKFFAGKPVTDYQASIGIEDPINTVYRLSVDYDSEYSILDLLSQFLEDANVSKITSLIIGMWSHGSNETSQPVIELLANANHKLPNLTAIFIGDIIWEECEISWLKQSDISPLIIAYPQLEHLQIRGNEGLSLGALKHDRLKTLIIESGGLSVSVVREVCQAQLPQLEHLELWLGLDEYGGDTTVEDLAPILTGQLFPKLNYLGLRDSQIADQIAINIANAPVMQKIKVLNLSLGNLGDIGATALLNSTFISQLEKLDLHHHYISEELMEELTNLDITIDVSEAQEPESYDDEEYRYIAVAE